MDFGNLKPSDIIGRSFASDGKAGDSKIDIDIEKLLGDKSEGMVQVAALEIGGDPKEIPPQKACALIAFGMQMAVEGFNGLHSQDKLTDEEREALVESNNRIHDTFTKIVERLHAEHAADGKCTCPAHDGKTDAGKVVPIAKKSKKKGEKTDAE